jgi:threonine dehydrogenase-like Zn-dependent dehydrogenase
MRALVVDPTIAEPGKRRGPSRRRAQVAPNLPLQVRDIRTPVPQGPGWVLVRPALSGICGTDLALVQGERGPSVLAAYANSGAFIPGHEIVGVVEKAGQTRWAREGHRVLVEPTLRCAHKGLPDCRRCRAGETHLCENADRAGALCSGRAIGSSERAGGGWSEGFLVHEDMLVPADGMSDQRGVLAEPAASALHAVLRWSGRGDRAVVIGFGALSRLVVATLRRLYRDIDITLLVADPPAPSRRTRLRRQPAVSSQPDRQPVRVPGADRVWTGSAEELLFRTADHAGARMMQPGDGGLPVLDGGVDVVFDCHGSGTSIDLALRLLRAGGTLVLCGRAGRHEAEWSLLWARELTVRGAASYGREANGQRTFAVVREWLTDQSFPVDSMVTHRFPLEDFSAALETAAAGPAAGAVKVVFEGPATTLRPLEAAAVEHAADAPVLLRSTAHRVRARAPH